MDPDAPTTPPPKLIFGDSKEYEFRELCGNCGFNTEFLCRAKYKSSLKLVHSIYANGVWTVGTDWFLKDTVNNGLQGYDYVTQEFLKKNGVDIPLVPEMKLLTGPEDKRHTVLMRRVPGVPLSQLAPSLTDDEMARYAREVIGYILEIRKIPAPNDRMEAVDGSRLKDQLFYPASAARYPGNVSKWIHLGRDREEWLAALLPVAEKAALRKHKDPEARAAFVQSFKDRLPQCKPYRLSHCDLNAENIMVHEGHVSGIIDWELAGFYPYWYEFGQLGIIKDSRWWAMLWDAGKDTLEHRGEWGEAERLLGQWESGFGIEDFEPRTDPDKIWGPFCACKPYCRLGVDHWEYVGYKGVD